MVALLLLVCAALSSLMTATRNLAGRSVEGIQPTDVGRSLLKQR
jgi:hypothetical protein